MPVIIIIRASKVTPQIYEAVRERVGWDKVPAVGAISHAIAFNENGAVEVNVWESRELYDAYVETRLRPVIDEMGIVLDEVEVLETHSSAVGAPALDHFVPVPREPERAPQGPVMAIYRRRNVPAELYEEFRANAPLDTVPVGALAHTYGRLGDDFMAVDVWEDGQAFVDHVKGVLIPAVEAAGMAFAWPEIVPVATFLTTPAAKAHERPFARPLQPAE